MVDIAALSSHFWFELGLLDQEYRAAKYGLAGTFARPHFYYLRAVKCTKRSGRARVVVPKKMPPGFTKRPQIELQEMYLRRLGRGSRFSPASKPPMRSVGDLRFWCRLASRWLECIAEWQSHLDDLGEIACQPRFNGRFSQPGTHPRTGQLVNAAWGLSQVFNVQPMPPLPDDPVSINGARTFLAAIARQSPSGPDGPFGVRSFRWGQAEHEGMRPKAWCLVSHLWNCPDRAANFDDLKEPVYGDHAMVIDATSLGSIRRDANMFFRKAGIPLAVTLDSRARRIALGSLAAS